MNRLHQSYDYLTQMLWIKMLYDKKMCIKCLITNSSYLIPKMYPKSTWHSLRDTPGGHAPPTDGDTSEPGCYSTPSPITLSASLPRCSAFIGPRVLPCRSQFNCWPPILPRRFDPPNVSCWEISSVEYLSRFWIYKLILKL